jgi:hypothetical protein
MILMLANVEHIYEFELIDSNFTININTYDIGTWFDTDGNPTPYYTITNLLFSDDYIIYSAVPPYEDPLPATPQEVIVRRG